MQQGGVHIEVILTLRDLQIPACMVKLFKRTKNYIKDVFLKCLLWIMQNVWTNYYFMVFMKFLCHFPSLERGVKRLVNWVNGYVEDHIIYFNKERRIAFVVEADNAIGYSLCKKLVKKNYHVILGVKDIRQGVIIKSRLLKVRSYASVSIVAIDMTNPVSVLFAADGILQRYKSLDVLYLNYSIINIDHLNWDVLKDAFRSFRLAYFCTTGRTSETGKNFVAVKGSGMTDLGFNRDFCEQVLNPFILAIKLSPLLKEATLPGRIVWTGSSTCSAACFSFDDAQHISDADSFYSHKYFVHLLQPALNQYLSSSGVQSFEGCPGVIITGCSPEVIRRFTWLIRIVGWFIPTIQVHASKGSRTLLHLGTHRRQYANLCPNHMYTIRRRIFGLQQCRYVKDVSIGESIRVFDYLMDLYKRLERSDTLIDGMCEEVRNFSDINTVKRNRRQSM